MALIGVAIGLVLSLVLIRLPASFQFGVGPSDAATLVPASVAPGACDLSASYFRVRRATPVDPIRE